MTNVEKPRRRITSVVIPVMVLSLLAAVPLGINAFAAGGTAKPVPGAVAPFVTATLPDPVTSVDPALIQGFDDTGFIQSATVDTTNANCPHTTDPHRFGGTLTLNNGPIVIPCNLVIQLPANTFTWADFINGGPSLALGTGYPSFEMRAVGNIVGERRIAGLLYASQHSLHTATGVITAIDYTTGNLKVDTGDPAKPVTVQINDPNGRFGRKQSPDPRFSVDDANPTIHASTGYPMCVPRTNPAADDDPLCPQANRPNLSPVTVSGTVVPAVTGGCRNFSVSAIAPPVSGELNPPAADQPYCSQYVMKSTAARAATDPDPTQQAPFEVGDSVTFSGTLVQGAGSDPDYISAHTVEANIGIYTMPGTQPSYLAIGEFGVGTADPNAVSINGFATEAQNRIFLESETTDVKTAVDIYLMDVNPVTGAVRNRWATPFAMTGEQNGPVQAGGTSLIGGGLTTQNTGPQPQRARLRATKAPVGLLSQPTRTVRVAVRSLCTPQAPVNDAAGNPVLTTLDSCLNKNDATNQVANGLEAGQYFAPTFEFIFPENVKPGDTLVPFDFWHLPFLRYGEGATTQSAIGPAVGPLEPTPWSGAVVTAPDAPTVGTATAGNATATVTWTPPASDGGATITGYTVTALDGAGNPAATTTVAGNLSAATVTGLTNGQSYRLNVAAGNLLGNGPPSGLSNAVTPTATAPGAPTIGTATAGDASALITWTPPTSDGGSPVIGYSVQAINASNAPIGALRPAAAGATSLTVAGLTNGTTVRFQVQAVNAIGAGAFSALSSSVTPMTVPGVPVIGTPTRGNASALVRWAAPTSDGGSPITGYTVKVVNTATNAQVGALWPAGPGQTSLAVTGLANGTAVRFQVRAVNAMGASAFSALSSSVTPMTVPGAPVIGTPTRGNAAAVVRWAAPATGGSPITGYTVRVVNAATNIQVGALRPAGPGATSLTVTGLLNGIADRFEVRATNAVGTGAYSALSSPVTPATTPRAPVIGAASSGAVGGTVNATARWSSPVSNGGATINGYVVSALRISRAGSVVATVTSTVRTATTRSLTMTLPAGTYRFVVRARNAVGLGVGSARSNLVSAR